MSGWTGNLKVRIVNYITRNVLEGGQMFVYLHRLMFSIQIISQTSNVFSNNYFLLQCDYILVFRINPAQTSAKWQSFSTFFHRHLCELETSCSISSISSVTSRLQADMRMTHYYIDCAVKKSSRASGYNALIETPSQVINPIIYVVPIRHFRPRVWANVTNSLCVGVVLFVAAYIGRPTHTSCF